jgi:hypothetical protein
MTATPCPDCIHTDHADQCQHSRPARRRLPAAIRADLFDVHPDILGEAAQPDRITRAQNHPSS